MSGYVEKSTVKVSFGRYYNGDGGRCVQPVDVPFLVSPAMKSSCVTSIESTQSGSLPESMRAQSDDSTESFGDG